MTQLPAGIRRHSTRDGFEIRIRYKDPITGEPKRASGYAKTLAEAKRKQREMLHRLDQNQRPLDFRRLAQELAGPATSSIRTEAKH